MKPYKIPVIVGLLFSVVFYSCDDLLDPKAETNLTEEFANVSYNNTLARSIGLYSYLPDGLSYLDGAMMAAASDEAEYTLETASIHGFNVGSWNANNNPDGSAWERNFEGIFAANLFLKESDEVDLDYLKYDPTKQQDYQNRLNNIHRWKYEARFLRAYYYYLLVQHFGGVALNTTMFESAVMNHARESAENVYQFVIDEFAYLSSDDSQLLERSEATGDNFGRANKRAAMHFLAKTYLARGYETFADSNDFTNAAQYAEKAINGEKPTIAFSDVFSINNEENDEIFWSVQYSSATLEDLSKDGNMQQSVFGVYLGGAEEKNKYNAGYLAPTVHLHNLFTKGDKRYEGTFMLELHKFYYDYYTAPTTSPIKYFYAPGWMSDADITAWKKENPTLRQNATVIKMSEMSEDRKGNMTAYADKCTDDYGVACIRKFDDPTSAFSMTGSTHDIILARLGETYLVAAEAYVKLNQPDKAKVKINELRERATEAGYDLSIQESDVTGEQGIDFILDERARELAGEYHRWMDLKRTGRLIQYVANGTYDGQACFAYNHDNIKVSDFVGNDGNYKILRPIPLDAINRNKETVKQNPGF